MNKSKSRILMLLIYIMGTIIFLNWGGLIGLSMGIGMILGHVGLWLVEISEDVQ